jgi:hypothetical protein
MTIETALMTAAQLALAVLVLEFAVLTARSKRGTRRSAMLAAFIALAPGACLLLALHAALGGAPSWTALVWLGLSLPAHLADLRRRQVR